MTNKLLKSGYLEKQVLLVVCVLMRLVDFRKKWSRRYLELRESELKWYAEEGGACDGYISLKDIASVEDCEYNIDKPHCLSITLVAICYAA